MTPRPAVVDRTPLAGIIPMTRAWYDCGNGYGVSTVVGDAAYTIAAGLWMDRRPSLRWRLTPRWWRSEIQLLHETPERVHVATEEQALELVEHVAALPPLGEIVPGRLLPNCTFGWCVRYDRPCTHGEAP